MTTLENNFATVHKIPHEDLGDVIAAIFPNHYLLVEFAMYRALESMTEDYEGGLWTGYTNDAHTVFFMVPPDKSYHLLVEGNYFQDTVDAETAGIITSLVVLNGLVWETRDPRHNELFYNLRAFALEHRNWSAIMAAID